MKKNAATLSGLEFSIRRKRIKNLCVRVTGDGRVSVSAPHQLSESCITAFVALHEASVRERLAAVERQRRRCYPADYASGDGFCMAGRRYALRVVRDEKAFAGMDGGELVLCVPPGQSARVLFARFFTREAKKLFEQRLDALRQSVFPPCPHGLKLSVRNMLTRWGSINTKRLTLSLSVHLLRCEAELIDYIITHELCHLQTPNHSRAFYKALEAHCPNRREMDRRLKEYGLVDF